MAYVNHLPMIHSDHTPILLRMRPDVRNNTKFHIEHWWMHLPGFDEECERLWAETEGLEWDVRQERLGKGLRKWALHFPLPSTRLKELENYLLRIQKVHPTFRDLSMESQIR
jgi:hypothetical protein